MSQPPNFITSCSPSDTSQAIGTQGFSRSVAGIETRALPYSVRDPRAGRTVRWWGMSVEEVKRVAGTMMYLRGLGRPCWYAVLGDHLLDLPEAEARAIFSKATSLLVQMQARAGLKPYWLRVLESTAGLHANLIFPASDRVAEQFLNSKVGRYLGEIRDRREQVEGKLTEGLQRIGNTDADWQKVTGYLTGERVSQGNQHYTRILGPRVPGSHRLGEGGGDRVQLSPALRERVVDAGVVRPWARTTSRNLTRRIILPPALVVQPKVEPTIYRVQDSLFPTLPIDTFTSPAELLQLREVLGFTQEQAAARLHSRSRAHISNAERGHDRLSRPRVRYLRYLAEAARPAA